MRNDFDKFIFDLFMMTYRLLMFAVEKYFTTVSNSEAISRIMYGEIYIRLVFRAISLNIDFPPPLVHKQIRAARL